MSRFRIGDRVYTNTSVDFVLPDLAHGVVVDTHTLHSGERLVRVEKANGTRLWYDSYYVRKQRMVYTEVHSITVCRYEDEPLPEWLQERK